MAKKRGSRGGTNRKQSSGDTDFDPSKGRVKRIENWDSVADELGEDACKHM